MMPVHLVQRCTHRARVGAEGNLWWRKAFSWVGSAGARLMSTHCAVTRNVHLLGGTSHRFLKLLVDFDLGLGQVGRRRIFEVLDADRVDSVPLVRWRLVLAHEHVAEMRSAAVADNFDGATVGADANVALVAIEVALVEGVPAAVLELGCGGVLRRSWQETRSVGLSYATHPADNCSCARYFSRQARRTSGNLHARQPKKPCCGKKE